jgi:signal transduction histidine kinase/DNA-binding response OmpR family regulator/ligand-binding sensor domain-containing protein
VSQVFEDKAGNIWVALWSDGLCRYDNKYQSFEQLPTLGKTNNPFTIFEDNEGAFWVGTYGDGLFRIDFQQGKTLPSYTQYLNTTNPYSISENSIYSITQDNVSGNLWVLSQMGLSVISDRKKVEFERINALELFSDATNYLNHIMKDRQGNIWIATSNDGVYLVNLNRPLFQSNTLDEIKNKFGVVSVHSIFENDDKIWLSLFNFGVVVVDKKTQTIEKNTSITNLFNNITQNQSNSINSFCLNEADGSIWIGGNGILGRILKVNNSYKYEDITINNKHFTNKNRRVFGLYSDSKNRMWIGARNGVFLFNKGQVSLILPDLNNVKAIIEDKNGYFWIGSPSKGVVRLQETKPNEFVSKQFTLSQGNINSDEINSMVVDMNGNVWAGTNNGGLNKYDLQSQKFYSQNKQYSILDEDIINIVVENKNFMWLATNNKVVKVDLANKTSMLFSVNDNIKISSFRAGAAFRNNEGKIYFAGGNGYCAFYPDLKRQKQNVNKVVLTDIEVYNQSIFNNLQPDIYNPDQRTLHLNYKQRNVGFEFSALNYSSPGNIYYAYKLTGVDKDWVNVDSKRRYVNYNSLSKGTYTFQVKATDENGVWIDEPFSLTIKVEPAPYETWWAYSIYFILFVIISYFIYRNVSNRIVLKRDILISRIEKQKSEELTQIKLRYFTNVSHELLTPLTIISCLIEDFNQNFPNQFKQYSIMKSNVSRLKRLLQQILDFRKVESGNMKLGVKQADLVAFVSNICRNNFEPLATEKHIQFSIDAPESLNAWFDEDKIDKIMFNILSNAFKHTSINGTIKVVVQTYIKHEIEFVKLFISDTGSGISQDRIPFIFDRFFGNEIGIESNGIGLSLTKELVEIHKGTISVESEINKGTTFVVEFPIDSQKYSSSEREGGMQNVQLFPITESSSEDPAALIATAVSPNPDIVVLVVEDNVDLLMVLGNTLSRFYKVLKASNGVEALKVIKDNEVDLIISDVMMPEMDGITLCRSIKEDIDYSHIPVLLLTAKNQIADRIESYNAGADAYISKPFEMEVLIARINSLIQNRLKRNNEYRSSLAIHPKESENQSMDGIFLRQAIEVVEENLANFDFTHDQLIDAMNTSKSTLYRKIKSLTGLSPSEFVRNIRLKHACIMLKNETGNVSDIAYAVGFNDPKYFSTCFKAEFGVSPREYKT